MRKTKRFISALAITLSVSLLLGETGGVYAYSGTGEGVFSGEDVSGNILEDVSENDSYPEEISEVIIPEEPVLEEPVYEEEIEEDFSEEDNRFDTLITYCGEDFFVSQLDNFGLSFYSKGKTDFVKKSKSYINVPTKVNFEKEPEYASTEICKAMSALMTMFPSKFNWMDTSNDSVKITAKYVDRKWNYKVSLTRSEYYTDKLQTSAETKIDKVIKKAYEYAGVHYPDSITYGIVDYIDNWICENTEYKSEYDNPEDEATLKKKAYYYSHNIFGPLLYGYGASDGYAKTASALLDKAGITNIYVVSDSHAYVYVMMNDDNWYLLDTVSNDAGDTSDKSHFLTGADGDPKYISTGVIFKNENAEAYSLVYPSLSSSDMDVSGEDIPLDKYVFAVAKGKTATVSVANPYYKDYTKKWSSTKRTVATVDEKGKVSALEEGSTTIKCTIAGKTVSAEALVYKFSGLVFDNNKSSKFAKYENAGAFTVGDDKKVHFTGSEYINLTVKQTKKVASAMEIYLYDSKLQLPTVKSSNKSVATAEFVSETGLSGDTIRIKINPLSPGKTTISVTFGGKTAKLTYTVTQKLQDEWFGELPYESKIYTGNPYTPAIKTNRDVDLPAGLVKDTGYTVKYSGNKNAGTATVLVAGKGLFSGTVARTFEITPIDFGFKGKYTCSVSKTFNGSELAPKTVVTYKDITLKKNRDYIVKYKLNGQNKYYTTAPVNKGVYTVLIEGTGNYSGTLKTSTYEIKGLNVSKLKLSCPSSIRYMNGEAVRPSIKLLYDENVIPEKTVTEYSTTVNYVCKYQVKQENGKYMDVSAPTTKGTYKIIVTVYTSNIDTSLPGGVTKNTFEKVFTVK